MSVTSQIVLWLYVIVLGVAVGAGLYESRIVIPQWRMTPPSTWQNTGLAFWAFVSTGPLTLLVVLGAYQASILTGPTRSWWLSSLAVCAVERVATFAYFIPTMLRMQRDGGEHVLTITTTLELWARLNGIRHGLSIVAWLLALRVLSWSGRA